MARENTMNVGEIYNEGTVVFISDNGDCCLMHGDSLTINNNPTPKKPVCYDPRYYIHKCRFASLNGGDLFTLDGIKKCVKMTGLTYCCDTIYNIDDKTIVIPFMVSPVRLVDIRKGDSFLVENLIVTCMTDSVVSRFLPTVVEKITW